jgi:hypothetical protein
MDKICSECDKIGEQKIYSGEIICVIAKIIMNIVLFMIVKIKQRNINIHI